MLEEDSFDLLQDLQRLALSPAAPRDTGLVQMPQMSWNSSDCRLGLQYKSIYLSRIQKLRPRFSLPGVIPIADVSQADVTYNISGTIKRLELKRVRAFQKEFQEKYNRDEPIYDELDELEIEDHSGKLKVKLVGCSMGNRKVTATDLPFGVQVVLRGTFKKHSNKFMARHIFLPELPKQSEFIRDFVNREGVSLRDKKMLVLSEPTFQQCFSLAELLEKSYSQEIRSITAVVIIGGMELKIESINEMTSLLRRLKNTVDVFIMPSSTLDRRRLYPLQPYNGNFFPESNRSIALCSNPQLFIAQNGMNIHITCGQNVLDFMKNCSLAKSEVEVLENLINFSHYCPTSPFSLKTEPYMEDQLVMEEMPHVMITGKAKHFQAKLHEIKGRKVLLVAVPSKGMGLVSLNDLEGWSFN